MGLYERDYYRDERTAISFRAPTGMVATLIGINVAVQVLDFLLSPAGAGPSTFQQWFAVTGQTLVQPWFWYRFLTYGFVHDQNLFHLVGNMLMLWIFGGDVEARYGRWEFLRFYLVCLVFASLFWAVLEHVQFNEPSAVMFGASGAIAGVVILFAQCFPRNTILAFLFLPMPAWVFGVLFIGLDMFGAFGQVGESNVAYSVHLAGAAFALLYYQLGWNFGRLVNIDFSRFKWGRRSRFRVYSPEKDDSEISEDEVDRILAKLYREGEPSLTSRERKTLQEASREYQRKRHQDPSDES